MFSSTLQARRYVIEVNNPWPFGRGFSISRLMLMHSKTQQASSGHGLNRPTTFTGGLLPEIWNIFCFLKVKSRVLSTMHFFKLLPISALVSTQYIFMGKEEHGCRNVTPVLLFQGVCFLPALSDGVSATP